MTYMPGIDLGGLQADLGGIPLGTADASGVAWSLQSLEGWDSPEVRAELQQREGDHGAWPAPVYLGERPITLAGTVTAPDRAALDDALERLRAAVGLGDTTLIVRETLPKQATVRRSGKLLMQYVTDRISTYSVLVTAADPRRYSTVMQQGSTGLPSTSGGVTLPYTLPYTISATTTAGQITAYNEGSIATKPVLTISGPVSQPQVIAQMPDGSVRFLNYSQDLAVGEFLVIDTGARTVVLNGNVSRRRFLATPTSWPDIAAGATVTFQFRAATYNPSALLTATWRSAWM